jgi:hypothetical protein
VPNSNNRNLIIKIPQTSIIRHFKNKFVNPTTVSDFQKGFTTKAYHAIVRSVPSHIKNSHFFSQREESQKAEREN